jgi:hypothetical protein
MPEHGGTDRDAHSPSRSAAIGTNTTHRDTPPEDVNTLSRAGLLTRGSLRLSSLPNALGISGRFDRNSPLTVAGAVPGLHLEEKVRTGFPISAGHCGPATHDALISAELNHDAQYLA